MKVSTKISLISGGTALVVLVVGVTSLISLNSLNQASGWVQHTRDVIQALEELKYNLVDSVGTQRAYIITGLEPFYEAYRDRVDDTHDCLNRIQQLVAAHPDQAAKLAATRALVNERLESLESTLNLYKSKGQQAAVDTIRNGRSMQFRLRLNKVIGDMEMQETQLLDTRNHELERSVYSARLTVVAGTLLALTLILISNYLLAQYVLTWIRRLVRASDNITHGRFDLSTPITSDDEFGDLASAFNAIGQQILLVTNQLQEQQKLAQRLTGSQKEVGADLREIESRLAAAKELVNGSPLDDQLKQLCSLHEAFNQLNQIRSELETHMQANHELVYRLSLSRERVEQCTQEAAAGISNQVQLAPSREAEATALKMALDAGAAQTGALDSILAALDLIATSADLENARAGKSDSTLTVFSQRLKEIEKQLREARRELQSCNSSVKSLGEKLLSANMQVIDALGKAQYGHTTTLSELSKQLDLTQEIRTLKGESIVQRHNSAVTTGSQLADRIERESLSVKSLFERLTALLDGVKTAAESTVKD